MVVAAACGRAHSNPSTELKGSQIKKGDYSILNCNLSEEFLKDYFGESIENIQGDQKVSLVLKIAADGTKTLEGSMQIPQYQIYSGKYLEVHPATWAKFSSARVTSIEYRRENGPHPKVATLNLSGTVSIEANGVKVQAPLTQLDISGTSGSDEFGATFSNGKQTIRQMQTLLIQVERKCSYQNMNLLKSLSN
jgi:hypothetical protein